MSSGVYRRNTFPCLWCFPARGSHTPGNKRCKHPWQNKTPRVTRGGKDPDLITHCWINPKHGSGTECGSATDKLVGVAQKRRRQPAGFLVQPVARQLISKFISFLDFIHNNRQRHTEPSVISRVKMSDTQIIRLGFKPNEEISMLVKCNLHSCRGTSVVSAVTPGCGSEPPDEHLAHFLLVESVDINCF